MVNEKNEEKKKLIIQGVERLIASRNVNDISLSDIAHECKISKGTLFYYYSSKDDIIFDTMIYHMEEVKVEYDEWLKRHTNDLAPERFLQIIFYKGSKLYNRAKMHIFLINECMGYNDSLRVKFKEKWNEWRKNIEQGVKEVFPNIQDAEMYAHILMLIIDGLVVQESLQEDSLDYNKLVNFMKKVGEDNEKQ